MAIAALVLPALISGATLLAVSLNNQPITYAYVKARRAINESILPGWIEWYLAGTCLNLLCSNVLSIISCKCFTEIIALDLVLSILHFLLFWIVGTFVVGFGPLKGLILPDIGIGGIFGNLVVRPFLAVIKLVVLLIKPISTAVRLYLNVVVGHLIFQICDDVLGDYAFLAKIVLTPLKLATMVIQAFIFYYFTRLMAIDFFNKKSH